MSDVTVAPPGAAPPAAPAPQQAEVPINPNPTFTPNPVGSQAPDKPVEHTPSDAVKRAFDRASNPRPNTDRPPQRAAPKAAEARAGHNQPPEETPPEKFDLKKRPVADQPRSERGTFAPRQRGDNADRSGDVPGTVQERTQNQLPPHAPYRDPPARMSEHGKRDWANTPETVRGDIHRVQNEFAKAYKYYKDDYEAFRPVRQYHEMAQKHGTTLERALNNYVSMEQKLRADPIGGLDVIINNLNLQAQDGRKLGLRDIAYHVLSQTPEQLQQIQQGNAQTAAAHQIGALHQRLDRIENNQQQMHTAQQFTYTRSSVDQFADNHPRFDELGDLIEQELKLGFDLNMAYRRAELLRPATHAAQTRSTSAQPRPVDRSIHGAPASDAASNSRRPRQPSGSPHEAVQNALKRMNGSM